MKRAAYQWGIGRYLYNLENVWCELDQYKKLKKTPTLPDWALPTGYKSVAATNTNYTSAKQAPSTRREPQKAAFAPTDSVELENVLDALKKHNMTADEAAKWVNSQWTKGRSYADMMKLIEQAKKGN